MPRYIAFIDDFELDIEFVNDSWERSIIRHEYPYRDGAKLDDLGERPRQFKFKIWFLHNDFSRVAKFLLYIRDRRLLSFIHPNLGKLTGRIESGAENHEPDVETPSIELTFVEETIHDEEPLFGVDLLNFASETFKTSQDNQMQALASSFSAAFGSDGSEMAQREIDPDQSLFSQMTDLTGKARSYVKQLDIELAIIEGQLYDVTTPANSITALVNYANNVPGRIIGAISNAVTRYATALSSVKSLPATLMRNYIESTKELGNKLTLLGDQVLFASCSVGGYYLAESYAEDESKRNVVRMMEETSLFDMSGNYRPLAIECISTANELDESLYIIRNEIQRAIDTARRRNDMEQIFYDFNALQELAAALQFYVYKIKLEREKTKKIELIGWMPVHALCLKEGLSYGYGERILKLNKIKNPTFATGLQDIYIGNS